MTKHDFMFRSVLTGLVVLLVASMSGFAQDAEYVGNSKCKICHNKKDEGEQWSKWKAEDHSKAFELLSSDEAKAVGVEKGLEKPPAESPECLKCHVTAYDVKSAKAPDEIKMDDGIQCESCHGPASSHTIEGKKHKSGDETADPKSKILKGDKTLCKTCHNDQSPTWKADRYTLEDGTTTGFDFKQAWAKIEHSRPEK